MGRKRIKFDLLIHDLKVPVAVIEAGITSLLEREEKYGTLTEKQKKVLRRALRNTKVTRTLVNDAMEVGRSAEGLIVKNSFAVSNFVSQAFVEIFDLTDSETAETIRDCVDFSLLKRTLSSKGIILHIDEDLWRRSVSLDERKMNQILRNLLNNALKYRKRKVELRIENRGDALFVGVEDDGDGIDESYHRRIFECYFQMDQEGNHCVRGHGLGLAGVMVLVEDMGGKLTLESDVGKGASFSVTVPLK
ncbi:sensor histidine kinase [Thermodesulfobacteriota bacterium]